MRIKVVRSQADAAILRHPAIPAVSSISDTQRADIHRASLRHPIWVDIPRASILARRLVTKEIHKAWSTRHKGSMSTLTSKEDQEVGEILASRFHTYEVLVHRFS